MEISNMLLKTIEITLDTIFRASETDIRVHGLENVPDAPVLYVINHFTRMETFLMPYIIKKKIKKYPISLAHESFFGGKMGVVMDKLGAVSTADPERDNILIGSLLADRHPVIIFPEGQMVKDKKLIEKGKYMVYNTGIRRPPHRGAARIALRSQFIREKLKKFYESGNVHAIEMYQKQFGFEKNEIEKIIEHETFIVPVNITYYPIRARNNALNRIVERFVKDLSDRLEEEIEVEGTMVIDGVDIDINFGKPIAVREYLSRGRSARKMLNDDKLYLDKAEVSKRTPFKNIDFEIMCRYMDSIYGMTMVNHDHILSYILMECKKSWISEDDLKNRAFLAIEELRKSSLRKYHTSLDKKQFYLLTDDFHDKYNSFIDAAISDGLIVMEEGCIYLDKKKFTRPYDFHAIRKDNIIEVLHNEIEPLTDFVKSLNKLMSLSMGSVKKKIRNHFIRLERDLFEKDYLEYFVEGESKPKNIGAPFLLKKWFSKKGVILVHGYMAAPEEMRVLAEFLNSNGFIVYGARLRGHGTAPEDLAVRNWEKWYDSVSRAYIIMKNLVKDFAIGGFSTGAGIALLQAANKPGKFKGVISINAPLKLKNIASRVSSVVVLWNNFLKRIKVDRGRMEFVTNTPENPHINYFRNPVSGVRELGKLMNAVDNRLKYIMTPTLIIQGSEDPVVDPGSGLEIFDKIGTDDKELFRVYAKRHGIVRGKEFEKVGQQVMEFLDKVFTRDDK